LPTRSRLRRSRRTVRLRLTALYGGLFLASGAVLLAIIFGLDAGRTIATSFVVVRAGIGTVHAVPGPLNVPPCVLLGHLCPPAPPGAGATVFRRLLAPPGARPGSGVIGEFSANLPTPQQVHRLLIESGIALAIMAVISIGLGWIVAGRVLRPLRLMTATARQISEENLNQRLAVRGPQDELKDLGDTIDGLLGRLETAFDAQRRFVANASHELRTPLAMMRTSLDVALGKPQPAPDVRVLAGKLEEGLDQADRLLEGLLLLARAQQGSLGEVVDVSVSGLVARALDANRAEIDQKHLIIDDASASAPVSGNATLLARMVANVIDNAVTHNVAGGVVRIFTDLDGDKVRLVVDSGGPVIDEAWARRLGEPFQRLGADRVGKGHGAGLGLSIVGAIVTAHGGSVQLVPRLEGGLRVVLELPVAVVPV
jgi:signal transduction histidine kinase